MDPLNPEYLLNAFWLVCVGVALASIPPHFLSKLLWLPDRSRSMGIHIMAGKGSGKSRLMGRLIAWLDFLRGIPVVIFDPHGPTIDNFLDKLTRLPRPLQEQLWRRVLYVDMSGRTGRVVPFPLYYRLGGEGLYEISQRYLDTVRKLDPHLHTASIEGWNPLWRIGTSAGMVLAGLDFQITEAANLIENPTAWRSRLLRLRDMQPEAYPAVNFFLDFMEWKEELRARRSDSFLNKVALFTFDPSMMAMFGASRPGIEWDHVIAERMTVLLDFRREQDVERRRLKMLWAFNYLLGFVKHRGAGRHRPISLIIDELTSLFSADTLATELFASDLDDLINVIARNYMVWLTLAHQELFQMNERAQKTLMGMGTQMLGVTSDPEAALTLARQFFRFDPYWVKKREPVYFANVLHVPEIIDYRDVEFTLEEQNLLHSYKFTDQGRFHFLVRTSLQEGDIRGDLRPVSLARVDMNLYTDEQLVAQAREILMERRGRFTAEVLREIEGRLGEKESITLVSGSQPKRLAPPVQVEAFDTMENATLHDDEHDEDNPREWGEKKATAHAAARRAR